MNLSKENGWEEGSYCKVGAAFTRFILVDYFLKNKQNLGKNSVILEKTLEAFRNVGDFPNIFVAISKDLQGHIPRTNRACYDYNVQGWQSHAVSRLVGNLASQYSPSKPFFEILVNSARDSQNIDYCNPFFVSLHANEKEVLERRKNLSALNLAPSGIAHSIFYARSLKKPEEFLREHKDKMGPNGTRMLKGLTFLQNVQINAQSVGNCWFKQPMRCLLASLYLEILSAKPSLTPEQAWKAAKSLYKEIHKSAIPYIETLLKSVPQTPEMAQSAKAAIEHHKQL